MLGHVPIGSTALGQGPVAIAEESRLSAISVRQLYSEVCDILLEPGALTGETISDSVFLEILNDCLRDLMQSSECFKKINSIPLVAGTRIYNEPYYINQPTNIFADEQNLTRSSGNYWDNSDYRWQLSPNGMPQEWRNDQVQEDQVEIRPAPSWTGNVASCASGLLGTFSAIPAFIDFTITSPGSALYGTISSAYNGSVYLGTTAPLFGTIGEMVCSTTNLCQISTYTFDNEITSLDSYVPDVPGSFQPYIKFMILSRVFGTDGEAKNPNLQKYYLNRTQEAIRLLRAVSQEILLEVA